MVKVAIITGITGQDGAYLAELLIKKEYKIIGLVRSYSHGNVKGLDYLGLKDKVKIVECDLNDLTQVLSIIKEYAPHEIYNLAAQSSVSLSFTQPIGTIHFNIISVLNILEAIRILSPACKFYQASSSEVFGHPVLPITEASNFKPISPYSISKASAHWITNNYRESYGLFCCSGFLFNHESYLRTENFFVKKVIMQAIKIHKGEADSLEVGNINIKRDFGWAPKYVEAMYLMLQQDTPEDFLICSNRSVSLRSIIEYVFEYLDISLRCLKINDKLFRPTEIKDIYGDNINAREKLGWIYDMSFFDVLKILIEEELSNDTQQN